ncbi:MAG: hypothetical protein QOE79_1736 [Sphingomonadales bacterium]|jgi:hypothetical protein|nr:hypothetical protein [Sphingomonadales bacterium]MEA3050470.1 hypothetical protein [Sphingomonadales bacterium]
MGSTLTEDDDGVRRAERRPLDQSARLRPNSWSSLEIRMVDLSELGFRAACEARLQRGGCVSLEIPGYGIVEAQVEWQRGDQFGARFLLPIALDRCEWTVGDRHRALAHLLVERAGAAKAGRTRADTHLRRQILGALPIRKGRLTA